MWEPKGNLLMSSLTWLEVEPKTWLGSHGNFEVKPHKVLSNSARMGVLIALDCLVYPITTAHPIIAIVFGWIGQPNHVGTYGLALGEDKVWANLFVPVQDVHL